MRVGVLGTSIIQLSILGRVLPTEILAQYFVLNSIYVTFLLIEVGPGSFLMSKFAGLTAAQRGIYVKYLAARLIRYIFALDVLAIAIWAILLVFSKSGTQGFVFRIVGSEQLLLLITLFVANFRVISSLAVRALWGLEKGIIVLRLNMSINLVTIFTTFAFGIYADEDLLSLLIPSIFVIPVLFDICVFFRLHAQRLLNFDLAESQKEIYLDIASNMGVIRSMNITAAFGAINQKMDSFFVGLFCQPKDVAKLAILLRIYLALVNLFDFVGKYWWIEYSKLIKEGKQDVLYREYIKNLRQSTAIGSLGAVLVFTNIGILLDLFLDWNEPISSSLNIAVAFYVFVCFLAGPTSMMVNAALLNSKTVKYLAIAGTGGLIISLILLPRFGVIGLPIANGFFTLAVTRAEFHVLKKNLFKLN
jgi:O-antigen/teichoic acid export membrane protein